MKLTKNDLENCLNKACNEGYKYVGIKIATIGLEKEEVIINSFENFDDKLNYYRNAYNDDLSLKSDPEKVKIVGFTYSNSFNQIEKDLLGVSNKDSITDCKTNDNEQDIERMAKEINYKLIKNLQKRTKWGDK